MIQMSGILLVGETSEWEIAYPARKYSRTDDRSTDLDPYVRSKAFLIRLVRMTLALCIARSPSLVIT